jgi:hypothetical protein
MWREKERNQEAARIADQLRPGGDALRRRRAAAARPQPNSGELVEALFETLNQTSAPMSKEGCVKYLKFIALRRPRTFLALLGAVLEAEANELKRAGTRSL